MDFFGSFLDEGVGIVVGRDILVCVDNPETERAYTIEFETSEFTALYAVTEQPVFATISISYVPGETCLEQMSLKRYLGAFREEVVYYEGAINQVVDDLVAACDPIELKVVGDFTVRGGIVTRVTVGYEREGGV
ncbi:MAG: preQ(1) synthase [Candidatus Latescibacteria bacterium]|nr:preQ(1) synthase [Candidatus Latescibacterota bacterium]